MRRERQPDFGQFFHLAAWRPLDYETRPGPNLLHELAYLSSYSHDARFRPDRMRYERKRLVIELERDCWEILQATGKLPSVRSELSVRGVSSLTVTLTERWVTGGLGTHCQALARSTTYASVSAASLETHKGARSSLIAVQPGSF